MYTIVGLGNPDEAYAHTRHNAGRDALSFWVLKRKGSFVVSKKFHGLIHEASISGSPIIALLPSCYMNESGGPVKKVVINKENAATLIVLYDDIDLPLGSMRISFNRSAGGHNGVKSVIAALHTEAFVRIRIGIQKPSQTSDVKSADSILSFVMGKFTKRETEILQKVYLRVGEAIESIIAHGYERAMNEFNT